MAYRSVTVVNPNLFALALQYLGDATQAVRIAALNGLADFYPQTGRITLLMPNIDATQTGGVPQQ